MPEVAQAGEDHRHAGLVGGGDRIEVRQGLLGGESLVLSPPAGLKDGSKVKLAAR